MSADNDAKLVSAAARVLKQHGLDAEEVAAAMSGHPDPAIGAFWLRVLVLIKDDRPELRGGQEA